VDGARARKYTAEAGSHSINCFLRSSLSCFFAFNRARSASASRLYFVRIDRCW
jgi:membrane protease subunit (stomatin/prohibitin family)